MGDGMARVMHLVKGRCEPQVEALGDLSVNVQPAKGITEASLGEGKHVQVGVMGMTPQIALLAGFPH